MGGNDRAASLPARDRHAVGRRPAGRGRRLSPLRASSSFERVSRPRPQRGLDRPAPPPRCDHQGRLQARPAAAGRSRLALPPPAPHLPTSTAATKARTLARSTSPGAANTACISAGNTSTTTAANAPPSSRSPPPASWPPTVGSSPRSTNHQPHTTPRLSPRQDTAIRAQSARDRPMGSHPRLAAPAPRQRASDETMVLRYPALAYQADHASRPAAPCRDENRATRALQPTHRASATPADLTNPPPYQAAVCSRLSIFHVRRTSSGVR